MECLLFLWWNFALYLACYLHDTLHCNIYMDGTMCMDGTSLCMNNVYGWNWCDMWYETYVLDMCWICAGYETYICDMCCKLWDLIKNRKNRQYAGSLPSATDGKELFAVCRGRQRSHVAANCASWELTHLVSLPTVADGKDFAVRGRRQRTWSVCLQWQTAKTLPSVADGKEPALCHQWQTAKNLPCSDV